VSFTTKIAWELIFVSINWHNDVRVGCKALSTLIKLIDSRIDLEEELNEFHSSFEWEKIEWWFNF
jgi:hypothetical protein